MANIGEYKVGKEWKKLTDVTGKSFTDGASYTIQNKGYEPLQLCEATSKPTTDKIGFIIDYKEKTIWTCNSGIHLWVKSNDKTTSFNIALNV